MVLAVRDALSDLVSDDKLRCSAKGAHAGSPCFVAVHGGLDLIRVNDGGGAVNLLVFLQKISWVTDR